MTTKPALPASLLTQMPMLAERHVNAGLVLNTYDDGRHLFDVKHDGVRAIAYVVGGELRLRNRRGVDITERYPDLAEVFAGAFPAGGFVFDGEIVVWNSGSGRFDFELALKRDCQSKPAKIRQCARTFPATFIAFDLLWCGHCSRDLRAEPLELRLKHLDEVIAEPGPNLAVSVSSTDGQAIWGAVEQFGLEGMVVKDLGARYYGRRHSAWLKVKAKQRVSAVVKGYEGGSGTRRNQVGALYLGLYDDKGKLIPVGKVGTGFKDRDHGPLLDLLEAGQFVVEVEFLGLTKNRELRQAAFKGVRTDCAIADCTLDQVRVR